MLLAAVVALVVAMVLTRTFARPTSRMYILDHPNERSLHDQPTPRTGGVAIAISVAVGSAIFAIGEGVKLPNSAEWLGGLAALIAAVSYLDDSRHLPIAVRFVAHVVASALLVFGGITMGSSVLPGFTYELSWWTAAVLTVLYSAWMINLYNFMDGMDGFAGGMSVIGFGTFALLGWWGGDEAFAGLNLIVAGAAAGFLIFNFPPARIFMGDAGSSTLGFLAAGMSLWGNASGIMPLWVSLIVFSPFIADSTVTLLRRLVSGEKVWEAHKTHYYQRLVQVGWGHRKTVLLEYLLMLGCSCAAIVAYHANLFVQWLLVAGVVLIYLGFFQFVRAAEDTKARHASQ